MNYVFVFALGIGFAAGLRSLTPPAVVAWAAHLGWLNLNNSPLAFMGSIIAVVIFSLLALFELFVDLQPQTPKRTAPLPLMARILTGGLCGASVCAASESIVDHRRDSGRGRRTNRSIRRLRSPEKIGRRAEHQRYFYRAPRRSHHDRTRLLLRHPLTLISAFQFSAVRFSFSQLRKGAWLPRSFTLSTNNPQPSRFG